MSDQKIQLGSEAEENSQERLPAHAAHSYICDMMVELIQIAEGADLKDVAAMLRLTVTAAKINAN